MSQPIIRVQSLELEVSGRMLVSNLSFDVREGESVGIVGPSGSGKTTLLRCIVGLGAPASGGVTIRGTAISSLSASDRARFRLQHIGMIFQFGGLLPELSVLSNVALPLQLAGKKRRAAEHRAKSVLDAVNMTDFADARPDTLSGGETQRVGIARALVGSPAVILADEPTGALDQTNSELVTDMLVRQARDTPAALIVATHDPLVYERMDRIIDIRAFAPDSSPSGFHSEGPGVRTGNRAAVS